MTPQDPIPDPAQSPPPPPRRLTRSSSDRMLFGVAGGVARYFGLDPALVRIVFAVLVVFGGFGLVVYGVAALVVPSDDGQVGLAGTTRTQKGVLLVIGIAALVSLPFTGGHIVFFGPGLLVLLVLGAIGVLVWRSLGGEGSSRLVRAAWLILAVAGSVLLGLGAAAAAAFGAGTAVAVAVIAAGVALTVGGFLGGARWLILPALLMVVPLAIVSAANIDLRGGVGRREYRPASVDDLRAQYRLGAGRLHVDLRDVDFSSGRTDLKLDVGAGQIELTVPESVCVQTTAHVGAGQVDVFNRINEGIDVDAEHGSVPAEGAPLLIVDARAGLGQIQLDREPSFGDHQSGSGAQPACTTA